ncbi:MAG: cation:proton antiporter [Phycisphaerales bacterium]
MNDPSSCVVVAASVENLPLLTTIAAGFAAAWVLGLLTHRLGLSPIVGYLLAGVVIGKHTPGFVGDEHLALQLAEIGVILLMFAVGLHFKWSDLLAVRKVAVPGAIVQSAMATAATVALFVLLGWEVRSTVVLGMAMAVASTVVLLRVLMDRGMLSTSHGHVAVGWLIVEDIFTVLALVLVPMMGGGAMKHSVEAASGAGSGGTGLAEVGLAVVKLIALGAIVLLAGSRVVPWILTRVARLRSAELFTLTVLVLSIAIAVGSAVVFGASVALGAFLAGMVVGQSPASHQAAADALPLRDAFAVMFFVAMGMLFDPGFLVDKPHLVAAGLAIVLIVKPAAALAIVVLLRYPARTALTVAIGLAQIGEFSFILAQVAREHGLMPEEGTNVLVATAMISITINPLLFRSMDRIERGAQRWPWLWRRLNAGVERRAAEVNRATAGSIEGTFTPRAIIVGYGPVGRVVDAMLRDGGVATTVIEMNIDTVQRLSKERHEAIYGDAGRGEVLEQAGVRAASHLIVTLPHSEDRGAMVRLAKELNPKIEVTVRARYLSERESLVQAGANRIVYEEGEAGVELARHVLAKRGVDQPTLERLLVAIRRMWKMERDGNA